MKRTISERCYLQNQSWCFERTVNFEHKRFKINIHRNAFDEQSYARVYLWDKTQWNLVVDAHISECVCKKIDYTQYNVNLLSFEEDYRRLLNEAIEICRST